MHTFDPTLIVSLIALVLPVIVGAVTNSNAVSWLKGSVLLVLSAVTGVVTEAIQHGVDGYDWNKGISNAVLAFLTAHIAYKSGIVQPVAKTVARKTDRRVLDHNTSQPKKTNDGITE